MAEWVTVHKAIPTEVHKVVDYLEGRRLHPVVLDDVEAMGIYRSHAHEVRIAVPETERDMAIHLLAERERQNEDRLYPLVKRSNVVVFLLLTVLGILAIVGLLDARGWWFAALWMLLTILVAYALVRRAWRKERDVPSPGEHRPSRTEREQPADGIETRDPPCIE